MMRRKAKQKCSIAGCDKDSILQTKLLTEQNTRKVERLVISAAAAKFGCGKARPYFKHGQWWVIVPGSEQDEIYSVVDSSPSVASAGFDFEQVL